MCKSWLRWKNIDNGIIKLNPTSAQNQVFVFFRNDLHAFAMQYQRMHTHSIVFRNMTIYFGRCEPEQPCITTFGFGFFLRVSTDFPIRHFHVVMDNFPARIWCNPFKLNVCTFCYFHLDMIWIKCVKYALCAFKQIKLTRAATKNKN